MQKNIGDPEKIVTQHINSFLVNSLEGVLSDYTNESVLMTQDANYTGVEEIRGFFSGLLPHFPLQGSKMELDKIVANGEVVYIVWHAKTPSLEVPLATDTFVIKEGKIHRQTFAGQLNFIR